MLINFSKMHGLGNDFVVIDAINQDFELSAETIRRLADRHFSVGFDQLLLVKAAEGDADFRYEIYNADGSEVAQCGNGARCFALFVKLKKLTDKACIRVETDAGELELNIDKANLVRVNMGAPIFSPVNIPLLAESESSRYTASISAEKVEFSAVSLGNPHAVIQVADINAAQVLRIGKAMESHPVFPERANIGFVQTLSETEIKLRVYERGAAETLACGSGACAAVVAGIELGLLKSPVQVSLPGGELMIKWAGRGEPVMMTGPATFVFDGIIEL